MTSFYNIQIESDIILSDDACYLLFKYELTFINILMMSVDIRVLIHIHTHLIMYVLIQQKMHIIELDMFH